MIFLALSSVKALSSSVKVDKDSLSASIMCGGGERVGEEDALGALHKVLRYLNQELIPLVVVLDALEVAPWFEAVPWSTLSKSNVCSLSSLFH